MAPTIDIKSQILNLTNDQVRTLEEIGMEYHHVEDPEYIKEVLKTPIESLGLSKRLYNALDHLGMESLKDIVACDWKKENQHIKLSGYIEYPKSNLEDVNVDAFKEYVDNLRPRNLGVKSFRELEEVVGERGLRLGMDISKYIDNNK